MRIGLKGMATGQNKKAGDRAHQTIRLGVGDIHRMSNRYFKASSEKEMMRARIWTVFETRAFPLQSSYATIKSTEADRPLMQIEHNQLHTK